MGAEGHEFKPKKADQLDEEDKTEMIFQRENRWCCCSCIPRLGSLRSEEGRRWVDALMKVREWTEVAAGPRWKTFIRRFNRTGRTGVGVVRHGRFQYDPLSYALNFDEGENNNGDPDEEEHVVRGNFSTRYAAAVPVSKDAPP